MRESSFIFELPQHLAKGEVQWCLDKLVEAGAIVQKETDTQYKALCLKATDVDRVGWSLYQTLLAKYCTVVAVSGDAQSEASAYRKPHNKSFKRDAKKRPLI